MTGDAFTMEHIKRLAASFIPRPYVVATCSPEALAALKRNGFADEAGRSRVLGLNVLFCTLEDVTIDEPPPPPRVEVGKITFNTLGGPDRPLKPHERKPKKAPWVPPVSRKRWER